MIYIDFVFFAISMTHFFNIVKYDQPAFQARPPNTLCTCITWLSATDIAVGSAHGFLAIWDINPLNASLPQNTTDATTSLLAPTPWLYLPLHGSYILGVTSAYPTYPHLLITSSIDGYTRLTDLRSPQTDTVVSLRSRIASPLLCFSPALVSLISTEDNDSARAYPLRCFYTSVGFARGGALPLCLSTGHFHPMVLVGCADGALIASNPMRKVLYRKAVQHQQTVFRHEWTRHAGRGVSRITEGYKAESMAFQRATKGSKRKKGGGGGGGGGGGDGDGTISTIHEAETAVTQVVWNSNLSCGGWIAAGMGNGLVRVQDLAI